MNAKTKLKLKDIEITETQASAGGGRFPKLPLGKSDRAKEPHLKGGESEASGSAVGAELRRARLAQGLDIADISRQLRIQKSYVAAMEDGQFANLPGLTYAIGYVRSYAQFLDLDAARLVAEFKAEASTLKEPTQLAFPSPAPEGKVPGGAVMFVGVILAVLAYGGWYYLSTSERSVADMLPGIPDRLASLLAQPGADRGAPAAPVQPVTAPAQTAAAPTTEPAPSETAAGGTAPAPAATEQGQSAAPAATTAPASVEPAVPAVQATTGTENAQTAPASPAVAPVQAAAPVLTATPAAAAPQTVIEAPSSTQAQAPRPSPDTSIPAAPEVTPAAPASVGHAGPAPASTAPRSVPRITISATDDSWVQVRAADTTPLMTRVMRAGENYEVPAREGLRLFTGNAGALKITVDGKAAPSLGAFGKIARNVALDETLLTNKAVD